MITEIAIACPGGFITTCPRADRRFNWDQWSEQERRGGGPGVGNRRLNRRSAIQNAPRSLRDTLERLHSTAREATSEGPGRKVAVCRIVLAGE